MFNRDSSFESAISRPHGYPDARRTDVVRLLATLTSGLSLARDPRGARERFEEELRGALQARAVAIRSDSGAPLPPPNVICIPIPLGPGEPRLRLEAIFDAPRAIDEWTTRLMDAASHVAAILLELERAGVSMSGVSQRRQSDGAAPLIGSSDAIRRMRDRIERVAATDFTVLIEGESGPQPHPNFIGFPFGAALSGGQREVEGAGEDAGGVPVSRSPGPAGAEIGSIQVAVEA